jgi:hypothetical protein
MSRQVTGMGTRIRKLTTMSTRRVLDGPES